MAATAVGQGTDQMTSEGPICTCFLKLLRKKP